MGSSSSRNPYDNYDDWDYAGSANRQGSFHTQIHENDYPRYVGHYRESSRKCYCHLNDFQLTALKIRGPFTLLYRLKTIATNIKWL